MSNAVAGKLIQIIKKYPVLYDPSNAEYRTKEVVEPLWQQIGTDLNENYMELRKRWRNLRDTYVKLLRLIKNSDNDEVFRAAAIRKYHKWVWTREFEFFRPFLTIGNRLGEVNVSLHDVDSKVAEATTEDEQIPKSEAALKPKKLKKEQSSSPPIVSSSKKVRNVVNSTRVLRFKKAVNTQPMAAVFNHTELDATDRLFLAHSQNIKQFSVRRQAITKLKIAEVIMQQEILDQEEKDVSSTSEVSNKSLNKRKYKDTQFEDEDTIMPFETVCGYDTDEVDEVEVPYIVKRDSDEEDPVDNEYF